MRFIKSIFDFYLHASIHVAIATWSLVCLTFHFSHLTFDWIISSFVFFSTLLSYNFIKYSTILIKNKSWNRYLTSIFILSLISIVFCVFLFFLLKPITQFWILVFAALTFLYAIPIGKHRLNLRNIAGIKIYIVSICWAGVTLLLPLLNAEVNLGIDVFYKFLQRFILTLILILIFEINDLKYDDIRLKTVPQSIGINSTKKIIYLLCVPFFILEFFKVGIYPNQWLVNLILVLTIGLFTYFANPNKSKYYTLFWVEAIPILWLFLSLLLK